jgi:hypothetical protein
MIKKSWMLLASLLLVGSLALTACGGGDDDDGDDNGGNTPAAGETVAADETPSGGDDGDDGDDSGSDNGEGSEEELLELAEAFVASTFAAVYDMSGDGTDTLGSGTITIYKDGSDRIRFDISGEQDGQQFDGTFIESPDGSYLCFSGDAAAIFGSTEGVCVESDPDDPNNPVGGITDDFEITEEDLADMTIEGREEREIAGEDAICYTTTSPDTTGPSEVCISEDGILLGVNSEGAGFTATSIEDDPSDADFEPPFPIEEIPGLQ